MATAQERYGDIVTLNLGLTRFFILSAPAHVGHVLVERPDNYVKQGPMWDRLRAVLGNGLGVSQGEPWRRQRRMVQPHFHRQALGALTGEMVEEIERVIDSWSPHVGTPRDMATLSPHMTMAVIVRAMFGTAIDDADVQIVHTSFGYILDYMLRGLILHSLPAWLPLPGRGRYGQALRSIDAVVYRTIEKRRRMGEGGDLLWMLLSTVDEETGTGMDDEELRDHVISLFLAGYETTANTISWALSAVAQQPEIARRIREEVEAVAGPSRPTFEHLARFTYTRQVVKETLRQYPSGWNVVRTVVQDDVIDGYRIPAGSQVMLSLYGSHHHPKYWADPWRFDPDRFSPEREKLRPTRAWTPFGLGQRMCIGAELAMMECTLVLAQALSRYEVTPVPGRTPEPKLSFTLKSRDGIWLELRPRQRSAEQR
jgi:cytochrome P450